jgi:hypothetical protein
LPGAGWKNNSRRLAAHHWSAAAIPRRLLVITIRSAAEGLRPCRAHDPQVWIHSRSRLTIEIVGLAVDLMLAQSFPGFKCLTAALAFKRPYAWRRGVRKFFFHLYSSRNNYLFVSVVVKHHRGGATVVPSMPRLPKRSIVQRLRMAWRATTKCCERFPSTTCCLFLQSKNFFSAFAPNRRQPALTLDRTRNDRLR